MARGTRRPADDRFEPCLRVYGADLDEIAKSHLFDQDLPAGQRIGLDHEVALHRDRLRCELALNAG